MVSPKTTATNRTAPPVISDGARALQRRLHELLSRLTETMEQVKSWEEAKGDDISVHVESTSRLIANIRQIVESLQRVEACVRDDAPLRESLQQCHIPLDLLDLLDSRHLNPDCFSRGLLREALSKLAGLKRRKLALQLLGAAIQQGINKKQQQLLLPVSAGSAVSPVGLETINVMIVSEPPTKKPALES
jgi:hypothetical protein